MRAHYLTILRDTERIVGPCHVFQDQVLAIVHIVIQTAGSKCQRGYRYAGTYFLAGIIYDSAFQKREDSVRHSLSMESEMLMVLQRSQNRIRNASDTDLKSCPIRNHFRDMTSDRRIYFRRNCGRHLNQRIIRFNCRIDTRDMNQGVAI